MQAATATATAAQPDPQPADPIGILLPFLRAHEGLARLGDDGLVYPYRDPAGFPTQGYGRLLSRDLNAALDRWQPITTDQADDWLLADATRHYRAVLRLIPVPLYDYQLAALTSFAFNVGSGNLELSTLRRKILRGDIEGATGEFHRWVWAGGFKLPGLVRRRREEAEMFAGRIT